MRESAPQAGSTSSLQAVAAVNHQNPRPLQSHEPQPPSTMSQPSFIQGLSRVLNCSKAQIAFTGLASTFLAIRYAAADLPPTQRASLWVAFVGAVAICLREVINAWTEEDVANANNNSNNAADANTTTNTNTSPQVVRLNSEQPLRPSFGQVLRPSSGQARVQGSGIS